MIDAQSRTPLKSPASFFLLGATSNFYISVGGQFYIGELMLVLLGLSAVSSTRANKPKELAGFGVLVVLAATGLVISSSWNGAPWIEFVRSFASLAVFALSLFYLLSWKLSQSNFVWIFLGVTIGGMLATFLQPDVHYSSYPWKFGWGLPVTLLVVILTRFVKSASVVVPLLLALSFVNLLGDYRSLSLLVLIAALLAEFTRRSNFLTRYPVAILTLVTLIGSFGGIAVATAYGWLATGGTLGSQGDIRFALQGAGSPLLMFLGGRDEIFFSWPAAMQNPILGYGPSPQIDAELLSNGINNLNAVGLNGISEAVTTIGNVSTIPTHSFIMGAWIESGILGLLLWIWLFIISVKAFALALRNRQADVLVMFIFLLTAWNFLFSPFGGSSRFFAVLCIAFLISSKSEQHTEMKVVN